MTTLTAITASPRPRTHAPTTRLLRSELRLVLRRPRTLIALGLLALVPVVTAIGISIAAQSQSTSATGPGPGDLATLVNDNGLVLPIFVLFMAMQMLLPMIGAMWAADALAGEASTGALRNLLVAPVGRARLLAVKAFGVAAATLLGVTVMAVSGVLSGVLLLGGDGMLTISGTTLGTGPALGRIMLTAALVTVQVWAVAAVALAISAVTEHPLVVLAVALGGIIVFGVLGAISALDWLHPVLITQSWDFFLDVMRDPMPVDGIVESLVRAGCYLVIGYSLAFGRVLTKDG